MKETINKFKRQLNIPQMAWLFFVLEVYVILYVIIVSLAHFMNVSGVHNVHAWIMKPAFLGSSLLLVLLMEYGFGRVRHRDLIFKKISPYITGVVVANIISVCDLSLLTMFIALLGYFMIVSEKKSGFFRDGIRTSLTTVILLKFFNIFAVYNGKAAFRSLMGDFLTSPLLDIVIIILLLVAFVFPRFEKFDEVMGKIKEYSKRFITFQVKIAVCTIPLLIHLFLTIAANATASQALNSTGEVYVIKNAIDSTLVLTETSKLASKSNTVSFRRDRGNNNQKVQIENIGHGIFKIYFLKSGNAMATSVSKKDGSLILCTSKPSDDFGQYWKMGPSVGGVNGYELVSADGYLMTYGYYLAKGKTPLLVPNGITNDCRFFIIEKTNPNAFVTTINSKFYADYKVSALFAGISLSVGWWIWLIIIACLWFIQFWAYKTKLISAPQAVLCAVMSVYLLVYGAISIMMIAMAFFMFVCLYGLCRKIDNINLKSRSAS